MDTDGTTGVSESDDTGGETSGDDQENAHMVDYAHTHDILMQAAGFVPKEYSDLSEQSNLLFH
jgi:hypothetical protein